MKIATVAMVLLVLGLSPAAAQTVPPAPEPYRPGLGDLMTMTVQPRHIKLALAGREGNWPYARYELKELREAFDRVTRMVPNYRGLPLGGMVDAIVKGSMAEIANAVDEKSTEKFATAYQKLTEGCNACHKAANVGEVAIKVPDASSFPDQDFGASRR